MTIALVAALAIGETLTALVITEFVLIAEILEGMTASRGRHAIGSLLDLLPRRATLRSPDGLIEVPVERLRVGDCIRVVPGARIPVDGAVLDGESSVDQSALTGESRPVDVARGMHVLAGSISLTGAIDLLVERIGSDTTFGRIVDAVEHAADTRALIQHISDRLAGYLVYIAIAAAALTLAMTHDAKSTIAVVIVAGACGVAAGTPLAILGAIGRAARLGVVIKGGIHLEGLWSIKTVVLDKTGTVTFGNLRVKTIYPSTGVTAPELLAAAAIAECRSEHPIGRAIVACAISRGLTVREPTRFSYVPGHGVRAMYGADEILVGNSGFVTAGRFVEPGEASGSTTVFVVRAGRYLGSVALADVPRPEARHAVEALHALGLKIWLLSGDTRSASERVANELGVDYFESGLRPDEKLARVRALAATGPVAMVGDGVNDAPALGAATVGIAMGSGTDVARESADIVLIGNDLAKLVDVIRLARRTRGIILQNFVGTVLVDAIGIGFAAAGVLTPVMAGLVHVTSELLFIVNAARLVSTRAPLPSPILPPLQRLGALILAVGALAFWPTTASGQTLDPPRSIDDDHAVVFEIGLAGDWSSDEGAHAGGTFAFEVTPVEHWLELEVGISAIRHDDGTEWPVDVLFKKPWRISRTFEFMIGAGPEVIHETGPNAGTFWGMSAVLDFMFWPRKNVGWYVEPGYAFSRRDGVSNHGLGVAVGLLIGR